MAAEEFFSTLHPDPDKQGVRIDRTKYDTVREAILDTLRMYGSMTFSELAELVGVQLQSDFDGSVMWYYTTVKLDLEARGEIRRVPDSKPQLVEIIEQG